MPTKARRCGWRVDVFGNLPVVEALLHAGAEIDLESQWGYTPLAQAVVEGHYAIARALLLAGASPNGVDATRPANGRAGRFAALGQCVRSLR